jgi:hypothetical protein
VREIVDAILEGIADVTEKQRRDPQAGLRASLEAHAGKTVERIGGK